MTRERFRRSVGKYAITAALGLSVLSVSACGGGGSSANGEPPVASSPPPLPPPPPPPPPLPPLSPPPYGVTVAQFFPALELMRGNVDIGGAEGVRWREIYATQAVDHTDNARQRIVVLNAYDPGGSTADRNDYSVTRHANVEGTFGDVAFLDVPSLYASGLLEPEFSVLSAREDKLFWYHGHEGNYPVPYERRQTISVENPCFVEATNEYFANDTIIGQIGAGLSVFDIESGSPTSPTMNFQTTYVSSAGEGRSLCAMMRGKVLRSYYDQYPQLWNTTYQPLTAIDFETNEVVIYGDIDEDNAYEELDAFRLETRSDKHLKIVDAIVHGTPNQIPNYIILLMTDGQHEGDHRLIVLRYDYVLKYEGQSDTDMFLRQDVYEWDEGVPVSMVQARLGGDLEGEILAPDIAVILGTSEHSLFFDNITPPFGWANDPPDFADPVPFGVGLGAGSAVSALPPEGTFYPYDGAGLLVSFPETGELRFVTVD